ncbi:MAG: hypothetical protein EZS28_008254 [Streblomastix strix]|uniref:Uncharacterized protein n=1 Tax=Streblomastix strix TaxID=222440 RepID=A0A5J4WMK5_9EUKA|nr:MAG: hypothetical protein EZS28_008254 [Streblomastix strix]
MNYQENPQILWQPKRLTLSPNLFIQLTGALDLYDGLSEKAANPIVNNASPVKFIDLETFYKVSHCKEQEAKASKIYVISKILLELQKISNQFMDINDNQQYILLTEPVRYDLLSQVVQDKRLTYKDEEIEYAGGNHQTAVTVTFFNNHITSPEDCDAFAERIHQHENGRLFKCGFDFGTAIQRSEVIIDPNYFGRDFVEAFYPGKIRYKSYKTTALTKILIIILRET